MTGNLVCAYVTSKGTCTANCVTRYKNCAYVTRKEVLTGNQECFVTDKKDTVRTLTVNSCLVDHVHFAKQVSAKERCKSQLLSSVCRNKACERCFLCRSVEFCKNVTNVPTFVPGLPVGARLHQFWKKWAALGVSPKC